MLSKLASVLVIWDGVWGSLPSGSMVKKIYLRCRRCRHWVQSVGGRVLEEMITLSHYSCLENPTKRILVGYILSGLQKSWTGPSDWTTATIITDHDYHHIPDVSTTKLDGIFQIWETNLLSVLQLFPRFCEDPARPVSCSGLILHSSMLPASSSSCPELLLFPAFAFLGPLEINNLLTLFTHFPLFTAALPLKL